MDAIKQLQFKVTYELRTNYQEKFSGNVKFAPPAVGLWCQYQCLYDKNVVITSSSVKNRPPYQLYRSY